MTPQEVVLEVLDAEFAVIPPDFNSTLEQLGLDSLDQVELLIRLEEAAGVMDTGAETFASTTTVTELISVVEAWGKK